MRNTSSSPLMPPQFDPATEHKPTNREVLLREVLRLRAQGLRVRDVAELLGMNPSAVEALIEGTI
jgi:DNA-binding NarL/FixJ family response regulator